MSVQTNLEEAASGLLMMSESDNPFTFFNTDEAVIDENLVLKLADKPPGTLVEKSSVDYLLRNVTNPASGSVDAQTAERFRNLAAQLNRELSHIEVYRVGEVQVDVFIIGQTAEGKVSGMRTLLIET
jgi:hypothetical protein